MYKLLCLILLSMTVLSVKAQGSLKGKVCDTSSQELPFSTVQLLSTDSALVKGTITDSLGVFSFAGIKPAQYIIKVSCTGYQSQYKDIRMTASENMLLPPFILKEDNILLGEVEVKGSSFIRQKDHVLIIPDKQQVKHASTGYDLLYNLMIPGVDVDRRQGSVSSVRGGITLYIDGRKVDYREVQSLRPRDIEKVEYYEVPTGKYAGDAASINYITKKWKSGGYVSLDADQTIGYLKGDYNAVTKLVHGNMSYTLFAGHTMSSYDENDNENEEAFHFPDRPFTREETALKDEKKSNRQYAQLNILNRKEKRTLLAKVSFVHGKKPESGRESLLDYSDYYTDMYSRTATKEESFKPSVELYGKFQLTDNQRLECTIPMDYMRNNYDRSYMENDFTTFSRVEEDQYNINPSLFYTLSLKRKNTLTAQLHHLHRITSSSYSGNNPSWQHLWSGETLFFLIYTQNIGKFYLSARGGLSYLQYRLHGEGKNEYISPRGELFLNYRISDRQSYSIGGAVGNAYPEINTINTAEQTIDQVHVKRGNPYLDKIKMYTASTSYNLTFGRFNLFAILIYSSEINASLPSFTTEGNRLVESFRDDGDYRQWQGALDFSWRITDALRVQLGGRWQYSKISGFTDQSQNMVFGRLNVNYYWKDFSFNLSGRTQTRLLNVTGVYEWQDGNYSLSASWHHGNWMAEAGANNLFFTGCKTRNFLLSDAYSYNRQVYSRLNQPTGYVKVAYTFDFGKKTSKDRRDVNTTINSAILKAE